MCIVDSTRTLLIADDHMVVRDGVRLRIAADPSMQIVGEAAGGIQALELMRSLAPAVALVDLRMPDMDGFAVAEAARDEGLVTRIIIYSALASPNLLERAFEAGAWGYVGKESDRDILFSAIGGVLRGDRFVDPSIAARMIGSSATSLTQRERQVLGLMGEGLANIAIARRLGLAPETVRHHVSGILRKLDVESRTHAVATALRSALIM